MSVGRDVVGTSSCWVSFRADVVQTKKKKKKMMMMMMTMIRSEMMDEEDGASGVKQRMQFNRLKISQDTLLPFLFGREMEMKRMRG